MLKPYFYSVLTLFDLYLLQIFIKFNNCNLLVLFLTMTILLSVLVDKLENVRPQLGWSNDSVNLIVTWVKLGYFHY